MGWEVFGRGPAPPSWDGATWPGVPWEPYGPRFPCREVRPTPSSHVGLLPPHV